MLPTNRPPDCAAAGGPTLSRVRGCINDELRECVVCGEATVHDMVDHRLFGFAANCPYGRPGDDENDL